jgi:hypothetical protein
MPFVSRRLAELDNVIRKEAVQKGGGGQESESQPDKSNTKFSHALGRVKRAFGKPIKAREEILFRDMTRHGRNERESLILLLEQAIRRPTLDELVQPAPPKPFSPTAIQKRTQKAVLQSQGGDLAVQKVFEDLQLEEKSEAARIKQRLTPKPKALSAEDEKKVAKLRSDPSFKSTFRQAEVDARSLHSLLPNQWLNDEVINFYGSLLLGRSEGETGDNKEQVVGRRIHYFNSYFYSKLSTQGYSLLRRWTKKTDIFAKDVVVLPINLSNLHWTAAAINFAEKRFEYYDSLGDNRTNRTEVFKNLRDYVKKEHLDKKGSEFDLTEWTDCFGVNSFQEHTLRELTGLEWPTAGEWFRLRCVLMPNTGIHSSWSRSDQGWLRVLAEEHVHVPRSDGAGNRRAKVAQTVVRRLYRSVY